MNGWLFYWKSLRQILVQMMDWLRHSKPKCLSRRTSSPSFKKSSRDINQDRKFDKFKTSWIRFSLSWGFPTWHTSPWHSRLSLRSASTAFFTLSSLRDDMTTLAPSLAKRWAIENPILLDFNQSNRFGTSRLSIRLSYPSVDAVTMATLFNKRELIFHFQFLSFAKMYEFNLFNQR